MLAACVTAMYHFTASPFNKIRIGVVANIVRSHYLNRLSAEQPGVRFPDPEFFFCLD